MKHVPLDADLAPVLNFMGSITAWGQGSEIMEPSPVLRFVIDYPLTKSKAVELRHDDGTPWTKVQFIEAVREAYRTIYAEEAAAVGGEPKHTPNGPLLNRVTTNGPYGIWGHRMSDLVLESASKRNNTWKLHVGS